MPITITLHIGRYTVTLTVKKTNRHPERLPVKRTMK